MLKAQPSQFKLADDGRIFYQDNPTNPLPGEAVAIIRKGRAALSPDVEITDPKGEDRTQVRDFLTIWLKAHIATVLEPLVALADVDALAGPARGICYQVFEAMGITPRENLEDLIAGLTPEMRQSLRAKNVRLGPILVFIPALNKPAAVRLRAELWSLWHEKPLPAAAPPDGASSIKVDARADRNFYQAAGYPVYGPRAIRIDMLDRVISAVYDNAKEGKFRAEHKMAEWLGCSIDDLYAVLEAMGHRRIEEAKKEESAAEETKPDEAKAEEPKPEETKPANVKPELAMFRLKKGRANEKPFKKESFEKRPAKEKRPDKKGKHKGGRREEEPRIISAIRTSAPEDSPFAALAQLKVKKDAAGQ